MSSVSIIDGRLITKREGGFGVGVFPVSVSQCVYRAETGNSWFGSGVDCLSEAIAVFLSYQRALFEQGADGVGDGQRAHTAEFL